MHCLNVHHSTRISPPFSKLIYDTTPFPSPPPMLSIPSSMFGLTYNDLPLFLSSVIINFNLSSSNLYFKLWPQLPGPPHIPSQDDVKPIKKTSQIHIFERIRRVPKQSGEPYLKETQPERKPEICTVKRDPFTFI